MLVQSLHSSRITSIVMSRSCSTRDRGFSSRLLPRGSAHANSTFDAARRRAVIGFASVAYFLTGSRSKKAAVAEDNSIVGQRVRLDDGVVYYDLAVGNGQAAKPGDTVVFHYVLRRSNGYFVYSTIDAYVGGNDNDGEPVMLELNPSVMVPGLVEVLSGMKPGSRRRCLIPPEVGYYADMLDSPRSKMSRLEPLPKGFGPKRQIISNGRQPLVFEVELLKVYDT